MKKPLLRGCTSKIKNVRESGVKIALSMMEGLQGRARHEGGRMESSVLQGIPLPKDVKHLRWDADRNHDAALAVLGVSYLLKGDDRRYGELALKFLSKAAEKNNALACYALALCYERGYGGSRYDERARKMYQKAFDSWQGMPDDEYNSVYGSGLRALGCGVCYENGEGVDKDMEKAVEWYRKAALQENATGQWLLGWCYANGDGVDKNMEKAVEWFEKSAEQGDAIGQGMLGWCYANGEGVDKDKAKAVEMYQNSAILGNATVQWLLGRCYANGEGVDKDMEVAVKWYRKSAEQGTADGQRLLGWCYEHGEGVDKDMEKAVEWYRKSAEQGDADGQWLLGLCYANGDGVLKDLEKAAELYQKSAEQGNAAGQWLFGWCYEYGEGVDKDMEKAVEWYRKSAQQGNADGQRLLGWCYEHGEGVDKDMEKAVEWYRKSAAQGDVDGQCLLEWCYANGEGVDKGKAVERYQKSAAQGDADGQWLLGLCYANGDGVLKDLEKAAEWYQKSAEQGNAAGQWLLGWCYEHGEGVNKDMETAAECYRKAAEQGDEEAKMSYQRIQGSGNHPQSFLIKGEKEVLLHDQETKLYKYCNRKTALATLMNSSVTCASSKLYNDVFECCVHHRPLSCEDIVIKVLALMKSGQLDMWLEMTDYMVLVYEGRSQKDRRIWKDVLTPEIKADLDKLHYSEKRFLAICSFYVQYKAGEVYTELLEQLHRGYRMCCFSETWDQLLMWGHYAEFSKGCVLVFDRESFQKMLQEKLRSKPVLEQVIYSSKMPDYHPIDFFDFPSVRRLLITKSLDWAYEKEWRMVVPAEEVGADPEGMERGFLAFEPSLLKEVVLGVRADVPSDSEERPFLDELRDLLKERYGHVRVYQVERCNASGNYGLERKDVTEQFFAETV